MTHPILEILQGAAAGHQPTTADIDRLNLPEVHELAIRHEAAAIKQHHADGARGLARRRARESAATMIKKLPDTWTPPGDPGPNLSDMTPDQLAQLVERRTRI